eukprot:GILI01017462.1.p1 GENE.GILI01017462.1~~GILI01017462.1.p1  ORF type:complete len:221 (+),score=13.77 GILI01017462.1:26-664(+)
MYQSGLAPPSAEELVASAHSLLNRASSEVMRLERQSLVTSDQDIDNVYLLIEQGKSMLQEALAHGSIMPVARQRSAQQLQEASTLEEALLRLRKKKNSANERQALMGSRPNAHHPSNTSDLSHLRGERESLVYSAQKLRGIVSESNAILGALKGQGTTLEGVQNKVAVDFLESIGVSNHTLLQIARTTKLDALLVYLGVFVLGLLMLYILFK